MNCRLQIHTHTRPLVRTPTHPPVTLRVVMNSRRCCGAQLQRDGGAGGAGRDDRINEPKYYRQFTLSQGCLGVIN